MSKRPQSLPGSTVEPEWGRFLLRRERGSQEPLRDVVHRAVKERCGFDLADRDIVVRDFTANVLDVYVHARLRSVGERTFAPVARLA